MCLANITRKSVDKYSSIVDCCFRFSVQNQFLRLPIKLVIHLSASIEIDVPEKQFWHEQVFLCFAWFKIKGYQNKWIIQNQDILFTAMTVKQNVYI